MPSAEEGQRLANRWLVVDDKQAERMRSICRGPHKLSMLGMTRALFQTGQRGRLRGQSSIDQAAEMSLLWVEEVVRPFVFGPSSGSISVRSSWTKIPSSNGFSR